MEDASNEVFTAYNIKSERLIAVLNRLSPSQLGFVTAMQLHGYSRRAAAESMGLSLYTVYRWPRVVNEALRLVAIEAVSVAIGIKAEEVLDVWGAELEGLAADDPDVRLACAMRLISMPALLRRERLVRPRDPNYPKSGIRGVFWEPHRNRWIARIGADQQYLGGFVNKEDAGAAYAKARAERDALKAESEALKNL